MKKLSTFLLLCILALTFCFTGAAYAQGDEELQLPNPGITPDSPFYFADIWGERIGLFFAFGEDAKVEKALGYAEERLAEVNAMMIRNNLRATIQAADGYDGCLALATRHMEQAMAKGIDTTETVALATAKHIRFFGNVPDNVSENATGIMAQAKERAHICQETAIKTMAKGDPEKAIKTNLMLMGQHLDRIKVMAEEPESLGLQEELRGFERLGNLVEEISQIAKGLGKDTTVDQLVGQATASHLQGLAEAHAQLRLHEQAQQAQGAIADAMQVCVSNHESVVTRLSNNDMLGEITEEAPIPEELPENVKQKLAPGGSGRK